MRTLVFHFGALGDFVLSWPALGLLMGSAGAAPAELHLVGHPAWGRLILPPAQVHARESARLSGLFLMEPTPAVDAWLTSFARAVVFAWRPDAALLAHLRLAGVREVWPIPTRPFPGQAIHAGHLQVQALRGRGMAGEAAPPPPLLEPPAQAGPPVIAPGSGGAAKRLAPELAAGLARAMAQALAPPLVVLGPAEDADYRARLAGALQGVPHRVMADPQVAELAGALRAAPAYAGADSGVTHLAAALGAPTLAVFQKSDPRVWAPRGEAVRVCPPQRAAGELAELTAAARALPSPIRLGHK